MVDGTQAKSLIESRLATHCTKDEKKIGLESYQTREPWMDLCEQAAVEQDSQRLLLLAQEIVRLLDEKENRLKSLRLKPDDPKMPRSNSQAA